MAFVGESGVGKSTIVDLVSGYYFADKGEVLIGGVNIKKIDLNFLRKNIAVVPQEVLLFDGTIKSNIKYGTLGASDKDIKRVAKEAYASEFIEKMPNKYNQIIGERGIKLSVGQKQRIAIAKAMLRDPKILILDEPTSALDVRAEKYISEALEKLMKGRTSIIIAHRLSTVRKVDKIFVFDRGEVVE
ncbi:MAG: ATP-binding cassette domain-containing protein, partial [Patescibacteria group bacterium]|nr:ATP-binding cassette domain-containing protein [Patescibacteria group bacterium]